MCFFFSYNTESTVTLYSPVEIIEEREQIKAQLTPGLLLTIVENVSVHYTDRIVHDL